MTRFIAAIVCILLFTSLGAQNKVDTLTNKNVIQLKAAGFSNEIIKTKIQSSVCNFDLSTDAMISLKKAGIGDDVLKAMLTSNYMPVTTSNFNGSTGKQDTAGHITPGIYYCKGKRDDLVELEASVYSQAKMGSGITTALTYDIAKTKMKATLSGTKANLQVADTTPVFYFYFDKSNQNNFGYSGAHAFWFAAATSPNEFLLVKFTPTKSTREVVTGSWNSYEGMSSGIDDQNKVAFRWEKLGQGVYKVYPEKPLKKGEYCFMYAGTNTYGTAPLQKVYDFGVY